MAGSPTNKPSPNLDAMDVDHEIERGSGSPTDELERDSPTGELERGSLDDELENIEKLSNVSIEVPLLSKGLDYFIQESRNILSLIMKHESAIPFLEPVDVLAQPNYNEVIRKPMDLGTILSRLEAEEESSRYKNMNDICADVRLVFTNAMKYNAVGSDVHNMAKELSIEFEKVWYPLSLEVGDELLAMGGVLDEEQHEEIKKSCLRKLRTKEKFMLADNMATLSNEDLTEALEIVAKYNPKLDASSDDVDIDLDTLDASSESDDVDIDLDTLDVIPQWMLLNFVEKCIKGTGNGAAD